MARVQGYSESCNPFMGERVGTSGNHFMIIMDFVLSMESKSFLSIDMLQFLWGHRLSCKEDVTKLAGLISWKGHVFQIEAPFVAIAHT
jgi:hypothetical protein